jgi:hypothetical protein
LSYVNIITTNSNYGVLSNVEGDFKLVLPKKFISEKLIFSRVGYGNDTITSHGLFTKPDKRSHFKRKINSMDEVLIFGNRLDPYDILKKAKSKIKHNFVQGPYNQENIF